MKRAHLLLRYLQLAVLLFACTAHGFSFSEYEEKENKNSQTPKNSILNLQCPTALASQKIATMIGEKHRDDRLGYRFYGYFVQSDDGSWDNRFGTNRAVYGSLVDELNKNFSKLGLHTYTADQINEQIAAEEQEAFLNNDMDSALTAAERLSADFMIKGVISTLAQTNKVVKIEEIFVTIKLSLIDKNGSQLASTSLSETSYSDADIPATIQQLINVNAENIVYQLFNEYCSERK